MKKLLKKLALLPLFCGLLLTSACSDNDLYDDDGTLTSGWFDGTFTAIVQGGSNYNDLIDSVIATKWWDTGDDWGNEIIAQGNWSNGSFTMTLPETVDSRFLFRAGDEFPDFLTISDGNARISDGLGFRAIDANRCIVGSLWKAYTETENTLEGFFIVFADRDVTITGEYTYTDTWEGVTYTDTDVWNVSLRRGWNWVRESGKRIEENHWQYEITTMSPPSGLRWHFDDWGPEWIECPPGDQQAITITATNVPAPGVQRVVAATWGWDNDIAHTVAFSPFTNNGFSMLLNQTPHASTLEPIGTMDGFTVSNPNARVAEVWGINGYSSATGAFLDGDFAGWLDNMKIIETSTEFSMTFESWVYADRAVSIEGTNQGSNWRETASINLAQGWNRVFQTFGAEYIGQNVVEFQITTTTPVSGLEWIFEPADDFPIASLSSETLANSARQRAQERRNNGLLRRDTQNVEQSPAPTVSRTAPARELREPSRGFSNRSERASRRGR